MGGAKGFVAWNLDIGPITTGHLADMSEAVKMLAVSTLVTGDASFLFAAFLVASFLEADFLLGQVTLGIAALSQEPTGH